MLVMINFYVIWNVLSKFVRIEKLFSPWALGCLNVTLKSTLFFFLLVYYILIDKQFRHDMEH